MQPAKGPTAQVVATYASVQAPAQITEAQTLPDAAQEDVEACPSLTTTEQRADPVASPVAPARIEPSTNAGQASPMEPTPTPGEAARRLAKFTAEVERIRCSPILASPPKQKAQPRKPTLPLHSKRIAAQPLGHVPTSKRGEVLLKQRMGNLPSLSQQATPSSASFDALFNSNLSAADMEALDTLFPATKTRAGRASRRPLAAAV